MKLPAKMALALLLAGSFFSLPAEVYWRTTRDAASAAELIPGVGTVLYRSDVTVNGVPLKLEVSRPQLRMDELRRLFSKWKSPHRFDFSGDTLRFSRKLSDGTVEHLLIVFSGRKKSPVCFRMVTPAKLPPPGRWPAELPPLPAGANPVRILRLSGGGVLGEFDGAGADPAALLRAADSRLRAAGFTPADVSPGRKGRGGIYFRLRPRATAWLMLGGDGRGAFYVKSAR